jgi:UDPglucose--hexose-1-phosphate uridylyltransferase
LSEANQLRRNPFTRKWTLYAVGQVAPAEVVARAREATEHAPLPAADPCPFCPGNEALTPAEILTWREGGIRYRRDSGPAGSDWDARVFPNRHPLFRLERDLGRRADRNHDVLNAQGANEIIVETRDHIQSFADVSREVIRRSLVIYRERMRDLATNPNLGHQSVYKHLGLRRASQIVHPYSQLVASPVVPENVRAELDAFRLHFKQKERCLACDLVREVDRVSRDCQVVDNQAFTAFVPFFAAHPFEVWVMPRRHQAFFPELPDHEVGPAAEIIWRVLGRIEKVLGSLAMTLSLHTGPNPHYAAQHGYWRTLGEDYHWRLVITPRLPVGADFYRGFVMGTGFDVNPVFPEIAGTMLREAGD